MMNQGEVVRDDIPTSTAPRPVARRINVAVSEPMLSAIDRVIEHEGVTLTEAVQRLMAYGDFVYDRTSESQSTLLVRDSGGTEREVVVH